MSVFSRWMIRIFQWEFWPLWVFYFPINFYFVWLAIRSRSFFFFTASNPTIDFGGMIGEKKSDIFELIPQKYYPKTILMEEYSEQELLNAGEEIGFPLIVKPDIGERGNGALSVSVV